MSIEQIAKFATEVIDCGSSLPHAGNYDATSIKKLVQGKKIIQSLYEAIFGRSPTIDQHLDELKGQHDSIRNVHVRIDPSSKKILRLQKTKWVFICTTQIGDEIFELLLPISQDQCLLLLTGIIPICEPSSMFERLESCLVVTQVQTGKEQKWLLKLNEPRSTLPLKERFMIYMLEDVVLQSLIKINEKRLEDKFNQSPSSISPLDMHLLRIWCIIHIDTISYNTKEIQDPKCKISIDQEWSSFPSFRNWAIQNGFDENYSLQRINRESDFSPSNCRWVDKIIRLPERYYPSYGHDSYLSRSFLSEQTVTIQGETKSFLEWEEISHVPAPLIYRRYELGYLDEKLIVPARKRPNEFLNQLITIQGDTKTIKDWAKYSGISEKTLVSRVRLGWNNDNLLKSPQKKK